MRIDKGNVEQMLFGMNEVCKFMKDNVCGYTADGILSRHKELTEAENAVGYVLDYADMLHGTFEMMSGVLGIITDGLANDEITITAK